MTNKYLFFALCMTLLFSCQRAQTDQEKFEASLTPNDLKVLNEWVQYYDDFLLENYPRIKDKHRAFCRDINDLDTEVWKIDSVKFKPILNEFEKSTLNKKIEQLKYDTVYLSVNCRQYGEDSFCTNTDSCVVAIRQNGIIDACCLRADNSEVPQSLSDWEKSLWIYKNDGYWHTINESSFLAALKPIKEKDIWWFNYFDSIETIGEDSPYALAYYFSKNEQEDCEDYFYKRLFTINLFQRIVSGKLKTGI